MEFKLCSQDSLKHICLHDCVIRDVKWEYESLLFYLNWVDVLKTHPHNNTKKAKMSDDALLVFENAEEIYCVFYDLSKAIEEGKRINKQTYRIPEDAEICKSNIIERCVDVEIDSEEEYIEKGIRYWKCLLNNDTEFLISFSTVWVCFNKLGQNAWFEY